MLWKQPRLHQFARASHALAYAVLQTQPGEYERANMRFVRAMNEFKIKHAKDFKFAYLMPLFGIVNAAVFISQFNAIRELAKEVGGAAK